MKLAISRNLVCVAIAWLLSLFGIYFQTAHITVTIVAIALFVLLRIRFYNKNDMLTTRNMVVIGVNALTILITQLVVTYLLAWWAAKFFVYYIHETYPVAALILALCPTNLKRAKPVPTPVEEEATE